MKRKKLSTEEFLPLLLSAAGAFGVFPFAILRLSKGEWLIGLLDVIIVVGLIYLGSYVWRTKRVRFASVSISILCIVGVLATVYVKGPMQIYWAYPVLLALFYLLSSREAFVASVALMVALAPALLNDMGGFVVTTVMITMLVTVTFAFAFARITEHQSNKLIELATRDPLTGAGNRRALEEKLSEIISTSRRRDTGTSMLLLDLDHFKAINDRHGHAVGDRILVRMTELINKRIRATDKLYRIGGEEFVVVTEGNRLDMAAALAEALRSLVEDSKLASECRVTMSVGVAELADGEDEKNWFRRADDALYEAKRRGRNQTCLAA